MSQVVIGEKYLIHAAFHDPTTGDQKDPTSPAAKYRTPSGTWTATGTPTKQDSEDGHYGIEIDTTGFAVGDYATIIKGTVATDVVQMQTGHFTVRAGSVDAVDVAGNVTVGDYDTGKSPADLVLATPANKLATDASGNVSLAVTPPTAVQIDTQLTSSHGSGAWNAGSAADAETGCTAALNKFSLFTQIANFFTSRKIRR